MGTFKLLCRDVIEALRPLPPELFHGALCDPPYGLSKNGSAGGFMGKRWDAKVPGPEYWSEVLRVLKPGAPILAFGGTRTYHRLACAIEDAGFEIFDSILGSAWVTGQGLPKSLAIDKAIDKHLGRSGAYGEPKSAAHAGWIDRGKMRGDQGHEGFQRPWMQDAAAVDRAARQYIAATPEAAAWKGYSTHLKPSWEPIVFARKPLSRTYAENCIEHGCGGLNIDGSRIALGQDEDLEKLNARSGGHRGFATEYVGGKDHPLPPGCDLSKGRYPANLILSHHPECSHLGTRRVPPRGGDIKPNSKGAGPRSNQVYGQDASDRGEWTAYKGEDGLEEVEAWECHPECPVAALDRQSEGASRFFASFDFRYASKVSTAERNAGLPDSLTNRHATLKPLALTTYLAKLILPPPHVSSRLLVPFCGTGSEMAGALIAGWGHVVGIDNDPESIDTAQLRIPGLIARGTGTK